MNRPSGLRLDKRRLADCQHCRSLVVRGFVHAQYLAPSSGNGLTYKKRESRLRPTEPPVIESHDDLGKALSPRLDPGFA